MAEGSISVLIVDDSAVVRVTLESLLSTAPDIARVDTASDPYVAAERMRKHMPDVMILDLQMPRMDGLTFLRKIMTQRPLPVIVCSAHVGEGGKAAMEALESGAVEAIAKPAAGTREFLEESRERVLEAVRAAASARVDRREHAAPLVVPPRLSADDVVPRRRARSAVQGCVGRIIGIGASTGGTEALRAILDPLPTGLPPILVVQHLPAHFTAALAKRLDCRSALSVREAADGDLLLPGHVYIAPGDRHMIVAYDSDGCRIRVFDAPPVNRHRPSVDVLFRSLAAEAGANAVGILLTGMGDDGAAGLLEMREAGARTIAQDEASCVVFGMPAVAIERGAAEDVVHLGGMAERIVELTRG